MRKIGAQVRINDRRILNVSRACVHKHLLFVRVSANGCCKLLKIQLRLIYGAKMHKSNSIKMKHLHFHSPSVPLNTQFLLGTKNAVTATP